MEKFRIMEMCKQRGMTLTALADQMGITRVGLSKAINGNTTIGTLEKVANALGCEVVELFAPQNDFIAFVRHDGETHTFTEKSKLKEFADGL